MAVNVLFLSLFITALQISTGLSLLNGERRYDSYTINKIHIACGSVMKLFSSIKDLKLSYDSHIIHWMSLTAVNYDLLYQKRSFAQNNMLIVLATLVTFRVFIDIYQYILIRIWLFLHQKLGHSIKYKIYWNNKLNAFPWDFPLCSRWKNNDQRRITRKCI